VESLALLAKSVWKTDWTSLVGRLQKVPDATARNSGVILIARKSRRFALRLTENLVDKLVFFAEPGTKRFTQRRLLWQFKTRLVPTQKRRNGGWKIGRLNLVAQLVKTLAALFLFRAPKLLALSLEISEWLLDEIATPLIVGLLYFSSARPPDLLLVGKPSASGDRLVESASLAWHSHADEPDHGTESTPHLRETFFFGHPQIPFGGLLQLSGKSQLVA
jgi:hypothetical protein